MGACLPASRWPGMQQKQLPATRRNHAYLPCNYSEAGSAEDRGVRGSDTRECMRWLQLHAPARPTFFHAQPSLTLS